MLYIPRAFLVHYFQQGREKILKHGGGAEAHLVRLWTGEWREVKFPPTQIAHSYILVEII